MTVVNLLGMLALIGDEYERSRTYYAESLTIAREIGDRRGTAVALANLGMNLNEQGKMEEARYHFEQALSLFEEIGDRQQAGVVTLNIGASYLKEGEDAVAWPYLERSLRAFAAMGDMAHCLDVIGWVGMLHLHQGDVQRAAELVGLTLRHPATNSEHEHEFAETLDELRQAMPADELEAAMARGAARNLDEVIAEVLAEAAEVEA